MARKIGLLNSYPDWDVIELGSSSKTTGRIFQWIIVMDGAKDNT